MEYREIKERINGADNISEILKKICDMYKIGECLKYKIVEVGYEDFNIAIQTIQGKYFVKILNKDRTDQECKRLANIYYCARNNGINVPRLYKNSKGNIISVFTMQGTKLRVLLMEYIEGINMYELRRNLTLQEIKEVAHQAAKINKIDFRVEPYYDEWTLTNFKEEYQKKFDLICEEDKQIVNKAYKEFIKIDVKNLPKAYIHGDIMNANLIKTTDKIYVIDFSALNYLPRIIELVVIAYGICIDDNHEESIKRLNYFLSVYNHQNTITKLELDIFCIILNAMGAMSIMQSSYIKAMHENFEENQYWLDRGKEVINLNLRREDIQLI